MKLFIFYCSIFLCCLLYVGCNNTIPKEVQYALELAGDNRNELERVLNNYHKKDKQKFRAACFLISNMRYHKSKQLIEIPDQFPEYLVKTDSLYHTLFNGMSSEDIIVSYVRQNGGTALWETLPTTEEIRRSDWQQIKDVIDGKKPLSTLSSDCED